MTDVPLVQFFVKQYENNLFAKFKKLPEDESKLIAEFVKHGFEPIIESQTSCPRLNLPGWVWIKGEEEMRDDWGTVPFDQVFLLIRWNQEAKISPSLARFVKNVIECILGLREYPTEISPEQQSWLDKVRPFKLEQIVERSSPIPIGYELKDGRKVSKVKGGPREQEINEMLRRLDTSLLIKNDINMF